MEESNLPELDELDFAILGHLATDGRRPFSEIAADLGVVHGTVRNRYNRMVSSLSLKVVSLMDPNRLGFRAGAQIRFMVEPSRLAETTTALSVFPEVGWLGNLLGEFNVICDVWCWNIESLNEFVSQKLGQLTGIRHMEIGLYSHIHKIVSASSIELAYPDREGGIRVQSQDNPVSSLKQKFACNIHLKPLDDLDIAILKILGKDGRTPFAEISEVLGVSRATIRKRFNGWCETGSLKTMYWFTEGTDLLSAAHIDLSIEPRYLREAIAVLVSSAEVGWTAELLGEFNLMADLICLNMDEIQQFIQNRIQNIPGLRNLEVNLYSGIQKMNPTHNLELLERIAQRE